MIKAVVNDKKMKPYAGTEDSAGLDLRIPYDMVLKPGQTTKVSTGIKVAIPKGYVGLVAPRSSIGSIKVGLANTIGVIDSDYRGEIEINLENRGLETRLFYKYDRVVQLIVVPHLEAKLVYVDSLDETERSEGGFGSTGVK